MEDLWWVRSIPNRIKFFCALIHLAWQERIEYLVFSILSRIPSSNPLPLEKMNRDPTTVHKFLNSKIC